MRGRAAAARAARRHRPPALLTGCRSSEIRALQWREVGEDVLALKDSKTGPRTVYLNRDAEALIERRPRLGSEYVFPSVRNPGRPCSERSLWNFWYMARERAGLADVRLHDLRHSHASQAVMKGVPLPVVSKLLGHGQTSMALRYAHVADRELEAAAERVGQAIARMCRFPGG